MALPWLNISHAATPKDNHPDAQHDALKLAFFYVPIGFVRSAFFPDDNSTQYNLTATLKPLESIKHKTTLITNLDRTIQNGTDVHAQCASCFLTSVAPGEIKQSAYPLSRTLDHILADHIGQDTPFPTLELSCNSHKNNKESIYFDNISWYGTGQVAPSLRDPLQVYRRLFGTEQSKAYRDITDIVLEDARTFQKQLGKDDKDKFAEYFESVRAIEKQIEKIEQKKKLIADVKMIQPKDVVLPRRQYIQLMGDLMIVALQTGLTRVATMMVGPERWDTPMVYEDVFNKPKSQHQLSHAQQNLNAKRDLEKIDHFHVQQFAYMVNKMDKIKEGNKSLLDNTIFTMGSGLGDGKTHQYDKLPIVVAGSGCGTIKMGQRINCKPGTPLANLWLSYTHMSGSNQKRFADSTRSLSEIMV